MIKSYMFETLTRIDYSSNQKIRKVEKPDVPYKTKLKYEYDEMNQYKYGININIYV
jgi:hypothetical protein